MLLISLSFSVFCAPCMVCIVPSRKLLIYKLEIRWFRNSFGIVSELPSDLAPFRPAPIRVDLGHAGVFVAQQNLSVNALLGIKPGRE